MNKHAAGFAGNCNFTKGKCHIPAVHWQNVNFDRKRYFFPIACRNSGEFVL